MALIDTYRNNIIRKKYERAKLIGDRSKENAKLAHQSQKIILAKNSISRTKLHSTIKSRLSEIERAEKEISNIYKKIADFDKKIAQKEKEINSEECKLIKEEARGYKREAEIENKRLKEGERQMKELQNKPSNQYINNGGQMNIANDNAIINVTFNVNNSKELLDELIDEIKSKDFTIFSEEEQEILVDNLDIIKDQLSNDEPKKGFVKTALVGITNLLYKSSELTEPLQKLIDFVNNIIMN